MIRNCYIAHMGPTHAGEYCNQIVILQEADDCKNQEMKADSGLVGISREGGGHIPNVLVLSTHPADEIDRIIRTRPSLAKNIVSIVGIYPSQGKAA